MKEIEAKKEAEERMRALEKIRAAERKHQAQFPSRSSSAPGWASQAMGSDIPAEPQVQTIKPKYDIPTKTSMHVGEG